MAVRWRFLLVAVVVIPVVSWSSWSGAFAPRRPVVTTTTTKGRRTTRNRGVQSMSLSLSVSSSEAPTSTTTSTTTNDDNNDIGNDSKDDDDPSVVSLDYTLYGPPPSSSTCSNTVLIFLHGLLGNKRNFGTIASAVSSTDATLSCYAVDLRNHGTSGRHPDMTYTSMARDVVHFCHQHQLSSITLIGHSMGGKVAQAVALLYPTLVDGLVVLDKAPVPYSRTTDESWKAVCHVIDLLVETTKTMTTTQHHPDDDQPPSHWTKRHLDQALRAGIPEPAMRAFCLTNWDDGRHTWTIPLEWIQDALPVLADFDLQKDNTPSSTQPHQPPLVYTGDVLLIHGGQSRFVRTAHLPTIQAYFPNHLITTIRGAGHWLHAEKPEDVISLLVQYLQRQ